MYLQTVAFPDIHIGCRYGGAKLAGANGAMEIFQDDKLRVNTAARRA